MSIITLILGVVVFGSASLTGMPPGVYAGHGDAHGAGDDHLAGGRCGQRGPGC